MLGSVVPGQSAVQAQKLWRTTFPRVIAPPSRLCFFQNPEQLGFLFLSVFPGGRQGLLGLNIQPCSGSVPSLSPHSCWAPWQLKEERRCRDSRSSWSVLPGRAALVTGAAADQWLQWLKVIVKAKIYIIYLKKTCYTVVLHRVVQTSSSGVSY